MTRLVIHVGPGKCGSTSIQGFFVSQDRPSDQNITFIVLDPSKIEELNSDRPSEAAHAVFSSLILDHLGDNCTLVLSHEYLFLCPTAVKNICHLAKGLVEKILIIGYSRRQSDLLVSGYSQWTFRLPSRVKEASNSCLQLGLDPVLFTGLERELIACIADDFSSACEFAPFYDSLNWYLSYQRIFSCVDDCGVELRCGILPAKGSNLSLIEDFCEKLSIDLRCDATRETMKVRNQSWNPELIESINISVALGLDALGPHESNDLLDLLSVGITSIDKDQSIDFLLSLKSYIDSYFLRSNLRFSRHYGIDEEYFSASSQFSKADILSMIISEGMIRSCNQRAFIDKYRALAAGAVSDLIQAKAEVVSLERRLATIVNSRSWAIVVRLRRFRDLIASCGGSSGKFFLRD